ncbi:MAG: head decoration protein [Rhodospirillales bacterium]|nr:head decoration protein [Rhodospirillales bacterium]
MTVLTEGRYTAEFLVSEANGARSRDVVTIASGEVLEPGTVLGKVTASGKYVELNPAGADGSEAAAAILYEGVDATAGDATRTALLRDAEVNGAEIVWPDGITAPDKTTAIGELAALGILVR